MGTRTGSLFLCFALLILAACDSSEPSPPETAPPPKLARSHSGYYLQMPLEAVAPSIDSIGGAVINVKSTLPDGTLAYITSYVRGQGEQIHLLHSFVAGTLRFRQSRYCSNETELDPRDGFDIQVVVVPDISLIFKGHKAACKSLTSCGSGPLQPPSVQSVLGRNFERLTGDSVTSIIGTPALVASAHYAWPKDACRGPLDFAAGTPRNCPPSTVSINEDESGANTEAVVDSIGVLIRRNRFCDLYNFTSDNFQRANTWSKFRDRILRWRKRPTLYALGGGPSKKGPGKVGVLESPASIEAYYLIWGREAVHAIFVAHAGRTGATKWEISRLELT